MSTVSGQRVSKHLRKLYTCYTDSSRREELHIFSCLLYKNRNQHRHGIYFRRLEAVRRAAEKIAKHVLWKALKESISDANRQTAENQGSNACKKLKKGKKRRKVNHGSDDNGDESGFIVFSSMMLGDLEEVERLLCKLVECDVVESAKCVTHQLLCRQHFMAFATCIVACLARLLVLERNLLARVRGALVEMRVALGISNHMEVDMEDDQVVGKEDLGEAVRVKSIGDDHMISSSSSDKQDELEEYTEERSLPTQQSVNLFGNLKDSENDRKSTIYELLAEQAATSSLMEQKYHSSKVPFVARIKEGSTKALEESSTSKKDLDAVAVQSAVKHETINLKTATHEQEGIFALQATKDELQGEEASDADIDDIFAPLE